MIIQKMQAAISSRAVQLTVASVLSGAISAAVSHVVTKRRLDAEYSAIVAKEIDEAKKFYSALHKKGDFATPEKVLEITDVTVRDLSIDMEQGPYNKIVEDAVRAVKTYGGIPPEDEQAEGCEIDPEEMVRNIFDHAPREIGEEEIAQRDRNKPYIITDDEFMDQGDFSSHQQVTLTYYDDDDVLADERDIPVDDIKGTVGPENLLRFGDGSNDSRIVYVRNERLSIDFEIVLHSGNYAEIVHGIVKEDDRKRGKKNRGADE